MVRRVTIKNFKSIEDLSLDLGRCTVFIGANGSGKSNILEAIALASAAASDKLDNEFMASRGIRVSDNAAHMTSAFSASSARQPIEIILSVDSDATGLKQREVACSLMSEQQSNYIRWVDTPPPVKASFGRLRDLLKQMDVNLSEGLKQIDAFPPDEVASNVKVKKLKDLAPTIAEGFAALDSMENKVMEHYTSINNFIIYSPEAKALRSFEYEGQILPLGIRGEGLFRLVKSILAQKDDARAKQIKESLKVIDWFSDFSVPDNLMSSEYTLRIRDRYLADDLAVFDQRSTNEGFLYLLFYFTLICAEGTPKFFAMDNIDDFLNPRLSAETIKNLVQLAKEHDKQFLATTHQPGLLDGLNLSDPEQILYVVFRNIEGRTSVRRVQPPKTNSSEPVRLSEAFIRGYLGGLPNHF